MKLLFYELHANNDEGIILLCAVGLMSDTTLMDKSYIHPTLRQNMKYYLIRTKELQVYELLAGHLLTAQN